MWPNKEKDYSIKTQMKLEKWMQIIRNSKITLKEMFKFKKNIDNWKMNIMRK